MSNDDTEHRSYTESGIIDAGIRILGIRNFGIMHLGRSILGIRNYVESSVEREMATVWLLPIAGKPTVRIRLCLRGTSGINRV